MDFGRIRSLATGAREALRAEVAIRLEAVLAEGSRERLESASQVCALEASVRDHGRDEVVDRAAYTWFNRLCALRFMDANGYTSTPVVTPRAGKTQPAILADAGQGIFDPEYEVSLQVKQQIVALLTGVAPSTNASEDAYSLLLKTACDCYAKPMAYLFAEDVASSLLMPQGLLTQGSILSCIVSEMDEDACSSVEVLGWLYQFYIAERKDEYFASKEKATAADIPAATQLFTPEWIVRYLTENSLGRLWMLNNPASDLANRMDYYVALEGDTPYVEIASADEIRVLDPACGSGHILVYAFDLLFRMYEEEGWPIEDIPAKILKNNLVGLEIDRRATEIASFALEMKARERDSRFFERQVDANVKVLEPVAFDSQELQLVPQLAERRALLEAMTHLDEVGSLYVPDGLDEFVLANELEHIGHDDSLFTESVIAKLRMMLANVQALNRSYHCIIANPPYMGSGNMNAWMSEWVRKTYPNEKADLCTCFINRSLVFAEQCGFASLITMHNWLFLTSYGKMRKRLISETSIVTMAHLGARAFDSIGGEVVQTTAAVFRVVSNALKGIYIRLTGFGNASQKQTALLKAVSGEAVPWRYSTDTELFQTMPDSVFAYWASDAVYSAFTNDPLVKMGTSSKGVITGDNARFLRLWYEVNRSGINFEAESFRDTLSSDLKWYPCRKGGSFRKWFGNNEYVINWWRNGYEVLKLGEIEGRNHQDYRDEWKFKPSITWSDVNTGIPAFRFGKKDLSESAGMSYFIADRKMLDYVLGLLNTSVANELFQYLTPTIHYTAGAINKLPAICDNIKEVNRLVSNNVHIARTDWDAFETSWCFIRHPMTYLSGGALESLSNCFARWETECRDRFDTLKANEEELNRIFARIYHMEGEVPIEVSDDKVSVRLADRVRDARSLISYGIGCLLGRYSAEVDGLVLADQGATLDDFREKVPGVTFMPDADNVLPILADEWFDDDVVTGFRAWLAHTFGEATVDENVAWLEESLGRDLRSYLCRNFYSDHLKVYQKRPIYWMFQSPKKSFQCLVYMHRYDEGTVGTILTGYLRPLEDKLRARLVVLDAPGASAADAREANKARGMIAELEQWEREVVYPLAHERVSIDLDDGVKVNYNKFPKALAKVVGLSDWK